MQKERPLKLPNEMTVVCVQEIMFNLVCFPWKTVMHEINSKEPWCQFVFVMYSIHLRIFFQT